MIKKKFTLEEKDICKNSPPDALRIVTVVTYWAMLRRVMLCYGVTDQVRVI